ncbi:MAG: RDD family protein, partial [Lentisphaerae bacterium]
MISRIPEWKITTPEGQTFAFQVASPFARYLAYLVDFLLSFLIYTFLYLLLGFIGVWFQKLIHIGSDFIMEQIIVSLVMIIFMLGPFIVIYLMEAITQGSSLGKRIFHLKIIDESGMPPSRRQIFLRTIARIADSSFPLFVIIMTISPPEENSIAAQVFQVFISYV